MEGRQPTLFREGESVDLHAPGDADLPEWASWFNDPTITRFLPQGLYPNGVEEQRRFLEQAQLSGRFLGLVKTKAGRLLGVVRSTLVWWKLLTSASKEERC